ncbi:MAG: MFS transporter [Ignavibacteriae bacterium HGW-Ignavibacteriae-2]|jgi:MFS family permease|nr:MAG: MFS transporter [Ignavibacteriae bacterium HGW-Ignavibacteriae-2]
MENKENKKTLKVFAAASFLNDMGSDMIYPIWPMFVTTVLGANMSVLGFIDGLGEALVSISQAASGYLSDRLRKRKIFVWAGYLFGSFSRIGYALSSVWQHLIPFRILDRAGKIRSAPRDAIIADISTINDRGRNFGILRMMDNLGALVGIIICILLFDLIGYKYLFMLAAIPSLIGVLLILFFIKEYKVSDKKVYKGIRLKDLTSNFRLYLLLSSFFALGSFSYSFLLIFANEYNFSIGTVPILYLIFTAVASAVSLPFGKLADKYGRKPILMIAYIFWGLVSLIFIMGTNVFLIVLAFIIYGLHKGALEPVQKTFISEIVPKEYRASMLGGFQMITGLCAFPASFIAGLLWDQIGITAPFYLSLFLTLISIILLFFVNDSKARI